MNFNQTAVTYILLILPGLFTLTVFVQGITKLKRHDRDGWTAIAFGVIFLVLIVLACLVFF